MIIIGSSCGQRGGRHIVIYFFYNFIDINEFFSPIEAYKYHYMDKELKKSDDANPEPAVEEILQILLYQSVDICPKDNIQEIYFCFAEEETTGSHLLTGSKCKKLSLGLKSELHPNDTSQVLAGLNGGVRSEMSRIYVLCLGLVFFSILLTS